MPRIDERIQEKQYKRLIEYLCDNCNVFVYVVSIYDYLECESLKKEYNEYLKNIKEISGQLDRYLIKKKHTPLNFIQMGLNDNDEENEEYETGEYIYDICFFKISEELKRTIIEKANKLEDWKSPKLPEDIMFIKDNYIKFSLVSHEKMAYIYCENEEEMKTIENLGIKFREKYIKKNEEYNRKESEELLKKIDINR